MNNIEVSRRTIKDINKYADVLKNFQETEKFDVLKALEQLHYILDTGYEVVPDRSDELEYSELAKYEILENKIYIRQRVYDNAVKGAFQALFTIAHEIGHAMLHRGIALYKRNKKISKSQDPEWQADRFAERLLNCKR